MHFVLLICPTLKTAESDRAWQVPVNRGQHHIPVFLNDLEPHQS